MVIAIDIRLLGKKRTGDEVVFRYLTREFLKLEYEATVLLLTDETDTDKIGEIKKILQMDDQKNVEIISLPSLNRYTWNFFTIPKFLRARAVDVFHTQYILPFFVPRQTKLFAHIHDVSFAAFPELIGWKDRFFLSFLIPRTMRIANRIIAVSEFTRDEIITRYGVDPERVVVIPNAVSDEFRQRVSDIVVARVREKYALPERFVLSVGTMQPRKNIALLVRAFALVCEKVPDLSLVLVGKRFGYRYDLAIEHALEEGDVVRKVCFPGYVEDSDLPAVYAAAHVFAYPSLYEGFGIPLLEAFSQGVPVIASDIAPSHEVAGDAALYFAPSSIASAEEMLYNVAIDENLRSRLLKCGAQRMELFSWVKSAHLLQELFRERINH